MQENGLSEPFIYARPSADADSAHVYNAEAPAGAGGADIRRADYIAALVEKMIYLAAPKSVVAGRYKINAA